MPELPEVQTTVIGIKRYAQSLSITDIWTNYKSDHYKGKDEIKNPSFFLKFKRVVIGAHIADVTRRAKNILIELSNGNTIIIHMKMTGHVLYGTYAKTRTGWAALDPGPLRDDPFNRHIRLIFSLSNGKHLALSDLRKFAKVTFVKTDDLHTSKHLITSGPEPLSPSFNLSSFKERILLRPKSPIKTVLMDPTIIAGIGNIYSDEILWRAGVHPLTKPKDIPQEKIVRMFKGMKELLKKGISFGGDSMSDYRNILGKPGKFQEKHMAYRKTGSKCLKPRCSGTILRLKIGGRSAHFCSNHQTR